MGTDIELLLVGALEETEHEKLNNESLALRELYAELEKDLERAYAYYLVFISPQEGKL